jgi:hypothetical protein
MGVPAIILGDPNSILRLPKAALRNLSNWSQMDSDILAHLLQVQSQIQNSRWNKAKISYTVQAGQLLNHSFPDFEDFVYAAVYVRQLIARKDGLLSDAVARYRKFADCHIRSIWVQHELTAFNKALDGTTLMLPKYRVRELFDAFMYGAGLLHKMPQVSDQKRKLFLQIYDKEPRHKVLFTLNTSLKTLMNYVGNVTIVIYRDYSNWLYDYKLPLPDTRWHNKLFEVQKKAPEKSGEE